jgi:hypothetical protein
MGRESPAGNSSAIHKDKRPYFDKQTGTVTPCIHFLFMKEK